jgi:hypothetical protein
VILKGSGGSDFKRTEENRENSVRITGLQAKIQIAKLPNMKQESWKIYR